ncbi:MULTISPECIES: glycerol-3-phosphate 1-O-acyltransferase PlsY [Asticcacaulis]|uniref:glycerol-3-phosphate 1-O-acyltransferase PlsY n=1 Tax=Asticcacaulis TaxID=76890 RepID=UPI001AE8C623|nr:glycerol-3-phosphate 1-O-acyltransferase PlsY [Asticcacaulis sp. BE141]MBP2161682.1 glycerol-3-phosphate acyltransferase PlsY [Asticcacaulis solisilvae]MDR6802693.1 glycerol-3-phosphate acyltransferase PlsY [Asticcacaulis sp. BE141]
MNVFPAPAIYTLAVIGGYLLGSIPFGVLATRMAGIDIRSIGSGNIGATNVLRTGRKDLALMTFVGDTGKGAAAVGLAFALLLAADIETRRIAMALAGAAAFLGHLFPVWLKFKGGKGVATFLGTLFAACWPMGLVAGGLWLLTAFTFRISSLSALVAAALVVPVSLLVPYIDPPYAFCGMALFMAVLIYIRHADNIKRLLKAEEPKIGKKKDAEPTA